MKVTTCATPKAPNEPLLRRRHQATTGVSGSDPDQTTASRTTAPIRRSTIARTRRLAGLDAVPNYAQPISSSCPREEEEKRCAVLALTVFDGECRACHHRRGGDEMHSG
ncbi:hypothetical protein ZWY2020_058246 [Hordeum vulgare]|nr:hypothetical protein ZWY2020_058246 [Hordeum vulgare]